jgi:hypothetical protein
MSISGWLGAIAVIMIAGMSPALKAKPPLIFKYPQRERNAALITASVFLALSIALALITPQWLTDLPDRFSLFQWSFGALGVLMLVISFLVLRYRKQPLLSYGWNKKLWRIGSRVGLALFFLCLFLSGSITLSSLSQYFSSDALISLAFLLLFNVAWETAIRGFIQPRAIAWLGETWGWLMTSVFSSLLMLPFAFAFGVAPDIMIQFIGHQFLLGWMMKRCGHVFPGAVWAASFTWFTML